MGISLGGLFGAAGGAGLGYLLAPFTGGLSIPAAMAIGGGLGGTAGSSLDRGDTSQNIKYGVLGAAGGYGAGTLLTPAASGGGALFGAGAGGSTAYSLSGPASTTTSYSLMGGASPALSGSLTGGMGGSFLSGLGGSSGLLKLGLGASILDYFTKTQEIKKQKEAYGEGLSKYLEGHKKATEMTDEDRDKMMRAVMGIFSEAVAAGKRKVATSAAAKGVAGGQVGKGFEKIEQQGREAAARSLAPTFLPSGQPPSAAAFLGEAAVKGRSAGAETMQDILGLSGQLASMALISKMFG